MLPYITNFGGRLAEAFFWRADSYWSDEMKKINDTHTTHIDKALAKSLATEHAGMHLQGAYTVCPYKAGTAERLACDAQWRGMLRLAGEL